MKLNKERILRSFLASKEMHDLLVPAFLRWHEAESQGVQRHVWDSYYVAAFLLLENDVLMACCLRLPHENQDTQDQIDFHVPLDDLCRFLSDTRKAKPLQSKKCLKCGAFFTQTTTRNVFCSVRCRDADRQRRYRKNKKVIVNP